MIAALFVEKGGIYWDNENIDAYDVSKDAMSYSGELPVVAHPPCQLWGRFAKINYIRWGGEHNKPGNDGGSFKFALDQVRRCGGVLEHPAYTNAWKEYNLPRPSTFGWTEVNGDYVCEVWQSAYGHRANKKTWLLYKGINPPFELNWDKPRGTHQIGGRDQRGKSKNKPTVGKKEASATPIKFRDELIRLAIHSRVKN